MHNQNCFLTLTFSPAALIARGKVTCPMHQVSHGSSVCIRDLQLFWKRLRKESGIPLSYYACGEYGEKKGRPHYHACVFGLNFSDRTFYTRTSAGFNLFTSEVLTKTWAQGQAYIGDVTYESAGYTARYVMKKRKGAGKYDHYVDKKTGELKQPEFAVMSRRPGLGKSWYQKFRADVYPHGRKLVKGHEIASPRYYDGLFEREDPEGFARLKQSRTLLTQPFENTKLRLAVRQECLESRIKNLKRSLEEVL